MSNIFEAATLAVYKIEPARNYGAAETVRSIINAARIKDSLIRADFVVCEAKTSKGKDIHGMVYISLPLAVHEADHNASKHVEYLRLHLVHVRKLECVWAPSNANDRSRAVGYSIALVKPDAEGNNRAVKHNKSGRFGDNRREFHNADPRLAQPDFRIKIVNVALARMRLREIPFDWGNSPEGQSNRAAHNGQAGGNITVDSPADVRACLAWSSAQHITIGWSEFIVRFHQVFGLLTPTACTTIALGVAGDGYDYSEHLAHLRHLLKAYKETNLPAHTDSQKLVDNIRMSEEDPRYLLCDPCDLFTAQGLCELPMKNGRFFRQVFFTNLKPAYYMLDNEKEHVKQAKSSYDTRYYRCVGDHPPHSGSTTPLIIEIADNGPYHGRAKPTELDDLRIKRLGLDYEWYMNQERNDPDDFMSPHRVLDQLSRWNAEIAEKTESDSERSHNAGKRYREDSDALETQISLHEETRILNDAYQWGKLRLAAVTTILARIQLRVEIGQLESGFFHVPRKEVYRHPPTIPEEEGVLMTREEAEAEYEKEREIVRNERSAKKAAMEIKLAKLIAHDPNYQPSETELAARPATPPNKFRVADPVAPVGPRGQEGAVKLEELPVLAPSAPAVTRKRKFEGPPVAASSVPPPMRDMGPPLSSEDIRKLQLKLKATHSTLKALVGVPLDQPWDHRDRLQREVDEMQQKLDHWTAPTSSSFGAYPQPAPYRMPRAVSTGEDGRGGPSSWASGSGLGASAGCSLPVPLGSIMVDIPAPVDIKPIITADIKPKLEPDVKPTVMGGNRWMAYRPPVRVSEQDNKPRLLAAGPGSVRWKESM